MSCLAFFFSSVRSCSQITRSVPICSPGFLFFVQLDLTRDRLNRADLASSGFLFLVQLDLVRDRLKRAELASSGFLFFVQLDLVRDRLKRADLYSPDFLFLVQLLIDHVRRSPEACRPVLAGLPVPRSA